MRFETALGIQLLVAAGLMALAELILLASKAVQSQPKPHWDAQKGRTTEVIDNVGIEVLEKPHVGEPYWRRVG